MIDTRRVIQLLMADGHTAADVMVWIGSRQEATLRDQFAMSALQGMCAGEPGSHLIPKNAAHEAYLYADAMIAARTA